MSNSSPAVGFVGNLAACAIALIGGAYFWDRYVSAWLGFPPTLLCTILPPVTNTAASIGVMLTTFGTVLWAVTLFRSSTGMSLMMGGVIIFVVTTTLPHYLGVACIP
ncbi:hypothetical protein QA648_36815 (plasmid) [Rhizobium sp. CB3171]|uniref:hypothetical protein n=1 Tax=Rhizobium sp. CB3171 TaxID=3039157 RepID=UPI0024B1C963|nr:hypothetical protein [Rhizobium sp. CB3171]WFU07542.1 hypothetical protein QA648_36815 [Rhizobium sp. CB3171]